MLFWAENFSNSVRKFFSASFLEKIPSAMGGGYPPFPLTFFAKFSRPLSGGGGDPLVDEFRDSGF